MGSLQERCYRIRNHQRKLHWHLTWLPAQGQDLGEISSQTPQRKQTSGQLGQKIPTVANATFHSRCASGSMNEKSLPSQRYREV
jgi:Uri superfamily endonuclease